MFWIWTPQLIWKARYETVIGSCFAEKRLEINSVFFSSLEGYDWFPFIGFLSWSSLLQPFRLYCICMELLYTEQNVIHIILLRLNSTKGICIITRSIIKNKSLARSSSVWQTRSFLFFSLWLKSWGVNLYFCPLFFFLQSCPSVKIIHTWYLRLHYSYIVKNFLYWHFFDSLL